MKHDALIFKDNMECYLQQYSSVLHQFLLEAAKLYPPLSDTQPPSPPRESFSDDDDDDTVDEPQPSCSGYNPSKRLCPSN